jgi:hypothetical protein
MSKKKSPNSNPEEFLSVNLPPMPEDLRKKLEEEGVDPSEFEAKIKELIGGGKCGCSKPKDDGFTVGGADLCLWEDDQEET